MSLTDQHRGRPLTRGQRDWLRVREYLQQHQYDLGQAAAEEYSDVPKIEGTPLLTRGEWLPIEPLPLDAIDLKFVPNAPFAGLTGTEPITVSVRPEQPNGRRYPSYSAAMTDLAAPAVFENRSTYRLIEADLSGQRGQLVFGRGSYFDGINLGQAAAHEYAASRLAGSDTPLRAAIGNPCDPARRPTNLAISALTIRHDRTSNEAMFLLHWRDPAKVGHSGGLYMVVPVGIFQASDEQLGSEYNDFSLWRCMVREYAEELLGESDDHSSDQALIDYDTWPFAARMTEALGNGLICACALGMGVDPLTFATDLLTVVSFDAPLFDELFADLVETNAEGRFVGMTPNGPGHLGFPFTTEKILQVVRHTPMQAAGTAALILAEGRRLLL